MNLAVMERGLIKPRLDRASCKIMMEPIKLSAKFSLAASSHSHARAAVSAAGNRCEVFSWKPPKEPASLATVSLVKNIDSGPAYFPTA